VDEKTCCEPACSEMPARFGRCRIHYAEMRTEEIERLRKLCPRRRAIEYAKVKEASGRTHKWQWAGDEASLIRTLAAAKEKRA
jgi:hypothetical protein